MRCLFLLSLFITTWMFSQPSLVVPTGARNYTISNTVDGVTTRLSGGNKIVSHSLNPIADTTALKNLTFSTSSGFATYLMKLSSSSKGGGWFTQVDSAYALGAIAFMNQPGATPPTQWVRQEYLETGYVRPEWWGAIGDGVADDAPAIQDAIDFAATQTFGLVLLSSGVYKLNSAITITNKRITLMGAGAGATRLIVNSTTNSGIVVSGSDVHSIEIAHLQIEGSQTATSGGLIDLREGLFDIKIHHIVTFYGYQVVTTAYGIQTSSTKLLDIKITDFEFRDVKNAGIYATMIGGLYVSNGVISFPDPQATQPQAGSRCLYLGDWIDGFWIHNVNLLGGETCVDFGKDWSSGGRSPAQGQMSNMALDSGWIATLRIRAGTELMFDHCQMMGLAGGSGFGVYIDGASTLIDGVHFTGGQCVNNQQGGLEIHGGARNVTINGMSFRSNSRRTNATWHGVYVSSGQKKFSITNSLFDNNSTWFGSNGQGYGLYIEASCDSFIVMNNSFFRNVTGDINNLSGAGTVKIVTINLLQ